LRFIATLLLAGAAFGVPAAPYAPHEFDFNELDTLGRVESVREVAIPRDLHAFDPEVLEHKLRPETTDEAVIRLDGGEVITVQQSVLPRLRAGQRVRVLLIGSGPRVEALEP
jgi:hypothetical protein